jgi:hypothetical protein
MPVILDQNGLAVDLPNDQASTALQQGTHFIPLIGPDGPTSAPMQEAQELLAQGYSQPDEAQLSKMLSYAKHSTPVEQAKTFAESAAKSATLGLSTGVEVAMGVDPKDIIARQEVNPGTAVAGDLVGFGASLAIPGAGAANVASRVGTKAAASVTNKLGAAALRQAAEMAIIQGGDEVSKAFLQDPDQSLQSVVGHIGLSAALGGGLGAGFYGAEKAIEPIWKITKGSELAKTLNIIKDRAQGVTGANEVASRARTAGIDLTPEMRGMLGTEEGRSLGATLYESGTKKGAAVRNEVEMFRKQASDQALEGLGRKADDLNKIVSMSEYEEGIALKKSLDQDLRSNLAPITKDYEAIQQRLSKEAMPEGAVAELSDQINKVAIEGGHALRTDGDAAKMLKSIQKDLPNIKSLEDLRKFQSTVREDLTSKGLYDLNRQVMGVMRDTEESLIERALGTSAPEFLATHKAARQGYKQYMSTLEDLNSRLRVGRYEGPESFLRKLEEMSPEDLLKRMKLSGDVEMQNLLGQVSPASLRAVQDVQLNKIIRKAANAPRSIEDGVDTRVLFKELQKLTPEEKAALFPGEQAEKLKAVESLLESLPERMNPSGTSRAMDEKFLSASGGFGILGAVLSGGSVWGALAGLISSKVGRELPDAIKFGMLKLLGSEGPVDAVAFKGMVQMFDQAQKAARLTSRVVNSTVKQGSTRIIEQPSAKRVAQLDEQIQQAQMSPETQMDNVASMSSYLPDQAMAAGTLTANAVNYLNSLRPGRSLNAPLDPKGNLDPIKQAAYERALSIAEQPLIVLESVKDGTLTPQDLTTISTLYPALYTSYQNQLMEAIADAQDKGEEIPYANIMTLGLFMGMPLESSQQPMNMMLNGMVSQASQPAPPPQQGKVSQGAARALAKGAESSLTPGQARLRDKTGN